MRLILSRKGFDSAAGGCPSPIFPDGSMISLPIPDKRCPTRYEDLEWRGHNLGDLVSALTRGRVQRRDRAHLDPDLRRGWLPRQSGWRPTLGQGSHSQGHLRNVGVGPGDVFLFWGLFRGVDDDLRWTGPRRHAIWGWMRVDRVLSVDDDVRRDPAKWGWLDAHPHLHRGADPKNTLYLAPMRRGRRGSAFDSITAGTFEHFDQRRCLTAPDSSKPSIWALPAGFLPRGRPPLTYHPSEKAWQPLGDRVLLQSAARGQEFVLDLDRYPEVVPWVLETVAASMTA